MSIRECDVHGLTVDQALEQVLLACNRAVGDGIAEVHVVHGFNQGQAIRKGLHRFLEAHTRCLTYRAQMGNHGCTVVWPRSKIAPAALASPVEERILAFCASPRTQEKIVSLLVRHCPEPEIKSTLDRMVTQGQVVVVYKNGRRHFRAASDA